VELRQVQGPDVGEALITPGTFLWPPLWDAPRDTRGCGGARRFSSFRIVHGRSLPLRLTNKTYRRSSVSDPYSLFADADLPFKAEY
jgi:hypothetical protein